MTENDDLLNPDEIEALLSSAESGTPAVFSDDEGEPPPPGSASRSQAHDPEVPRETPAAEASPPATSSLDPDEIEELLKLHEQAAKGTSHAGSAPPPPPATSQSADDLLQQVEKDLAAAIAPALDEDQGGLPPEFGRSEPFEFRPFDDDAEDPDDGVPLKTLEDVELDLCIELGRSEMLIEEVLQLAEGSVVPLDKLAGDPVDILVNGRLIARGEVLVLNDNFCVRIAEILIPS